MWDDLTKIRSLVGEVFEQDLRFVDCFISRNVGLFVPAVGPCFRAITPDHAHPAYSFILTFDDYARISVEGRLLRSRPGQVMAIDPGAVHHEIIEGEPPRYVAIFISPDFFMEELVRYSALKPCPFDFRTFTPGREFLKPWVERMGIDVLSVFRVEGCRALIWTMATNFAPKEFIDLTI